MSHTRHPEACSCLVLAGILGLLLVMPTFARDPNVQFEMPTIEHRSVAKIPLHVQLVLTPELCAAEWEKKKAWEGHLCIEFGDAFSQLAESMARAAFEDVTVIKGPKPTGVGDLVLVPDMVTAVRNRPMYGPQAQTTSVVFRWKALTPAGGDLVWVETIIARGVGKLAPGINVSKGAAIQTERMLVDLFTRSFEMIMASPEIRAAATADQ